MPGIETEADAKLFVLSTCADFSAVRRTLGNFGALIAERSHSSAANFYHHASALMDARNELVNAAVGEEMRRRGNPYVVDGQWSVRRDLGVPVDVPPLTGDDMRLLCLRDDARDFPPNPTPSPA